MSRFIICTLASLITMFSLGCETKDDNKLAAAQDCLDNLRDSDGNAAAQSCADKVAGLTSPESYVIRCSVDFFVGGVKSSDIADAFAAYNNAAESAKAAILMANLAQSTKSNAQTTLDDCVKSQVSSLIYIATVSQVGTILTIDGGSTTPATFLANCSNVASPCDDAAIGTAVTTMYGSYCVGSAADSSVCKDVAAAIQTGGGNPTAIADALYQLLGS